MPKTFYITTPIYYVNDVPHLGHAYTTIAADVLARYQRLKLGEDNVFFLTGLDEHGQKVQQAAAKAGIAPQAYCDQLAPQFQNLWKRLNISNNAFIRTTDPQHKAYVQKTLQTLFDQKQIYRADYTGWYCTFDERFWTEKDVVEGLCPDCKRPVDRLSESNYFFRMGQYQQRLIDHIQQNPAYIQPPSRSNEVLGFLQRPLEDLSISRPKSRLSWGIELPFDTSYVTYVWFDALVNYISALEYLAPGSPAQAFNKFWPAATHLVGKDILTTHAVYWSTILMALELPLPNAIFAHGWWTVNGEKMSKSRGNVVDPHAIIDEFGVDAFRYFLLREVPFGQDGDFSKDSLISRINSELANDLGNLLSRTITLIEMFSEGKIPEPKRGGGHLEEEEVKAIAIDLFDSVEDTLNSLEFHRALAEIWKLVDRTNLYIEQMAPWKLAKKEREKEKLATVLYTAAEALRFIALYISPFMPQTADSLVRQLGLDSIPPNALQQGNTFRAWGWNFPGKLIKKGLSLFPRIQQMSGGLGFTSNLETTVIREKSSTEDQQQPLSNIETPSQAAAIPAIEQISIEDFKKVVLRVGLVVKAERVPKSTKLLKLQVDLGSEQRQIVAGIATKYAPEDLVGKRIIIVANLKPAKLMGIESQGMVLAAGDQEVTALLTTLEDVAPGSKIK